MSPSYRPFKHRWRFKTGRTAHVGYRCNCNSIVIVAHITETADTCGLQLQLLLYYTQLSVIQTRAITTGVTAVMVSVLFSCLLLYSYFGPLSIGPRYGNRTCCTLGPRHRRSRKPRSRSAANNRTIPFERIEQIYYYQRLEKTNTHNE